MAEARSPSTALAVAGPALASAGAHDQGATLERPDLLERLDDPVAWPGAAAAALARFGFLLVGPARGHDTGHLLVALRDRPTLRHFDPESVAYYAPVGARAGLRTIDRASLAAVGTRSERPALWGHLHVVDRVPVENRFLTFGGSLRIAVVEPGLTVLDLRSPGPIVRWGGNSQGSDPLAGAVGAFFARVMVPVDFEPGVEARLDATPAAVLYGAFLLDHAQRVAQATKRGAERSPVDAWVAAACMRAKREPDRLRAAETLLRELRLP
jgi:hypothetical protein